MMKRFKTTMTILVAALVALAGAADPAHAGWKDLKERLKKKGKQKVEKKIEDKADRAMDNLINCVAGDIECMRKAEEEGKEVQVVDKDGKPVSKEEAEKAKKAAKVGGGEGEDATRLAPGEGVWDNYDFIPGERVIFFEDFTKDRVGNVPKRIDFKQGALEVVEWEGQRFMRATNNSVFDITLPEQLPERFTIEFDFADPYGAPNPVYVYPSGKYGAWPKYNFGPRGGGMSAKGGVSSSQRTPADLKGQIIRGRIMFDGGYGKSYINEHRVTNVPNANPERSNKISFWIRGTTDDPAFIKNISINAGGLEMYDALEKDGRYVTQGIFFATGSARLRPESTPTLHDIAYMLEQHPDLSLTIEGHTDDVGDDASNQELSEKRAAAVRDYLVNSRGVAPDRLNSRGYGESKPTAPNDSSENRQKNRRVELVKG